MENGLLFMTGFRAVAMGYSLLWCVCVCVWGGGWGCLGGCGSPGVNTPLRLAYPHPGSLCFPGLYPFHTSLHSSD